jgi:hypothetical protein
VSPKQCPACGRFLERAFIETLRDGDAPCPRCEGTLTAAMFAERDAMSIPAGGSSDAAAADTPDAVSVRPPDLEPGAVRDRSPDVLAGWDTGVSQEEIASWRHDRRPFPTDTVVVVGAGLAGLALGVAFDDDHRLRGAVVGALIGILGSAISRQVWHLRI